MKISSPPPGPVLVLLVEDDDADRELIQAELRRGGIEAEIDHADTLEGVRERLDRRPYDIVLCDYRLRGWHGMAVLPELRSRGQETPLILVSGTIGEELAVECLHEGATDCVLKGNLTRLPFVVRRALDEARAREERAAALEQIRRLSVAVDQSPAAIFITDTTGTIEYVNRRFTDVTGYTEDEALGEDPRILQSARTPGELDADMWAKIARGEVWRGELMNRRKNGDPYWAQTSISPLRGSDGVVTHFVAVQEDVSERRRAEDIIREREARLRQIAENIHEVFFVMDSEFRETLFVSPAYEEIWGRTRRSVYERPRSFMEAIHPDDRADFVASVTRIRAGEDPGEVEFRVVRPDGEERWVRADASPVLDEHGYVYRIAGVALDVTERRLAENRLRESEERYRFLTEASFDAVVLTVDGVIEEVNPGFQTLLGYRPGEVTGRRFADFVAEESAADVRRRTSEEIDGTYEVALLRRDGRQALCEATDKTHTVEGRGGRVTALRDVTEKRALEGQLRQSQKLEAVGRLAGGVAHDFNNMLTVILTELELLGLSEGIGSASGLEESLQEIEAAAKRGAALTRQLLTFSRRDVVEPEILDPGEVARGLQKMLARLIGEDVRLELLLEEDTGKVRIDRGQLEQVIVNLAVNARDAMPHGGDLQIEVAEVVLDGEYARTRPDCTPGPHVLIAVSDTGVGMSADVRSRLFEPFFTTKPVGEGTGLGLATSYSIVRDCGGHIGVYSEPDVGTTMKVYLPVREAPPDSSDDDPDDDAVVDQILAGTVLVVEDDDAVRTHAVRALERAGCHVLSASNGSAALEILHDEASPVDVLVSDVVMPGLSGPDLVARARELRPELKILYTTGYTTDMALRHRLLDQWDEVLAKPYTPQDLYRKVRALTGQ